MKIVKKHLHIGYWLSVIGCCLAVTGLTACGGADSAMRKGDKFFALGEYYDATR